SPADFTACPRDQCRATGQAKLIHDAHAVILLQTTHIFHRCGFKDAVFQIALEKSVRTLG
ncbi:MAG: hypothetical protein ACK5V0_01905, partial [Alphaproteobacteria bacterium]